MTSTLTLLELHQRIHQLMRHHPDSTPTNIISLDRREVGQSQFRILHAEVTPTAREAELEAENIQLREQLEKETNL